MADDKRGREDQARDADRRQRQRDVTAELERMDETEPPVPESVLDAVEDDLAVVSFPATGAEIVAAVGDRTVDSPARTHTVADLVPDTETERFDSPAAVRVRIQRPSIAAAMKRVVEAIASIPNTELGTSQREAYEKTFRELEDIDADDENEGIKIVADWIVDRIREKERVPGSRDVRREAAEFCRANGYEIRNDEWLGI